MATALFSGALPKDVDQIAVQSYPLASNIPVGIPIPNNLSVDDDAVEDTLEGAGTVQDTARVPVSLMWNFEVGGVPLEARSTMMGEIITEVGRRPNRVKRMPIHNNVTFPYFRLLMRAADNDGGDTLYTLPWCVLTSVSDDRSYGSFGRLPFSGRAVARGEDDAAGWIETRQVASEIDVNIPQEYGNRPFGFRAAAVARDWFDTHVWRNYEYSDETRFSGSSLAYAISTEIYLDFDHYDVSNAGLALSKQADYSTALAANSYTISNQVLGNSTSAVVGTGVGVILPTSKIASGTVEVTRTAASSVADFTVSDTISILPDESGDWTYNPSNGQLLMDGLATGVTVYYRYDTVNARVLISTGVADGDTVYFSYIPSTEVNLRILGGLNGVGVYSGETEDQIIAANQFTASAVRVQRGLDYADNGGKIWLRTGDHTANPTFTAGDNLVITGTGFVRKSAALVHPNTCNYSVEMTEYSAESRDRLSEFSARANMISLSLEAFGYDFDVVEIMTGIRAITSGAINAKQARLNFNMGTPSPFFSLVRQSTSSESTDAARDVFPRVKITSYGRPQNQGEFNMFNVSLNGIGSEDLGPDRGVFAWIEQWETAEDIDLETI